MSFEHKPGWGSLFSPNEGAPRDVAMSGEINVDGQIYWISLWKKKNENQRHYSISVKRKEAKRQERVEPKTDSMDFGGTKDFDDEVPF